MSNDTEHLAKKTNKKNKHKITLKEQQQFDKEF